MYCNIQLHFSKTYGLELFKATMKCLRGAQSSFCKPMRAVDLINTTPVDLMRVVSEVIERSIDHPPITNNRLSVYVACIVVKYMLTLAC